ncbi:hypothetical protein L596_009874 [Steinernema carpocapsae]|uniref:Uncharacterized protein n=1 Tax=Steinernema carpocapsae TaxID=34508 RepID=A0A4U5PGL2_STECR|nr:hypothetical protein L596_009874 [Steinernema carpocapsae]
MLKENRFRTIKFCEKKFRTREIAFFVFITDFLLCMIVAIELGAHPLQIHMIGLYIVWLLFFYTVVYRPYDAMVVMLLGIECIQFLASVLLSVVTILDGILSLPTSPLSQSLLSTFSTRSHVLSSSGFTSTTSNTSLTYRMSQSLRPLCSTGPEETSLEALSTRLLLATRLHA